MLREDFRRAIRNALGPSSPYPLQQGIEIDVVGDERTDGAILTSPIAMVLSRTLHYPVNNIASYIVSDLVANGYNASFTGAGFIEVHD